MQTVNPELRDLQQQVVDLRDRLSRAEGEMQQLNRISSNYARQTIWQFVIFTVTMAGILIGALNYQTNAIRNELNARFETIDARFSKVDSRIDALEKRMDDRIDSLEKRLDQRIDLLEKNLSSRFEDLKQEVRKRK